jgi:hypothetical protein
MKIPLRAECPDVSHSQDVIHTVLGVYDPKGTYSRHAGVVMVYGEIREALVK